MAVATVTITGNVYDPEGVGVTKGTVSCKLSQPGSALDGAASVRVAGEGQGNITAGGLTGLTLVPNDAITPSGTYYIAVFEVTLATGRRVRWAEKWQLASTPSTIDIGAVPRLDVVPGVALGLVNAPLGGDVSAGVVTPTGATTARSLRDRAADVVNVKDFGAKGDTAWNGFSWVGTDDTAAIQAAVNTAATSVYSVYSKPFGGSTVYLPPGAYKITAPITLRHGVRIAGAGREATMIVNSHAAGALLYSDASPYYVSREIAIENLSIWQNVAIAATSGAGIEVNSGTASPSGMAVRLLNLNVEGTYYGILISAGLGGIAESINVSRTVSHGVYVKWDTLTQKYSIQTTSTSFRNVYSYFGGGSGFRFEGAAYISCDTCASDSNAAYGYYLDTTEGVRIHGGGEQNALGGIYMNAAQGSVISLNIIQSSASAATQHGVTMNNANDTTLLGGFYSATANSTGYAVNVLAGSAPTSIGPTYVGYYATHVSNTTIPNDIRADGSGSFRFANIYATNWNQGGTFYVVGKTDSAIGTAASGVEGTFSRPYISTGGSTGKRTALVAAVSDGAGNYVWQNMLTGYLGTATTWPTGQARGLNSPTYGAAVSINNALGDVHRVVVTDAVAFSVSAPAVTDTPGARITVTIKNATAGAIGAATWNAAYKMAAWTQPSAGNSRSITFAYDGTHWIEVSRTPADVPN